MRILRAAYHLPLLFSALFLAGCGEATRDLGGPVEPLGDFRLGFSEVVAPNLEKLLISRDATPSEWTRAVDAAIERRFGRFTGSRFYHLGVSVEAFSLPPPVVPGRSALALRVTVWDDATQTKLNPETEVISVIRVFESRLAMTREDQIRVLSQEAARQIELWLRQQQEDEGWFAAQPLAPVAQTAVSDARATASRPAPQR